MGTRRRVVAVVGGFLVVVLITLAWLVVLVVAAWSSSSMVGHGTDNDPFAGFMVAISISSIIGCSMMYFALLGLGHWASDTPESRTATVVAGVVTGVFAAAALAVLVTAVVGYLRG